MSKDFAGNKTLRVFGLILVLVFMLVLAIFNFVHPKRVWGRGYIYVSRQYPFPSIEIFEEISLSLARDITPEHYP